MRTKAAGGDAHRSSVDTHLVLPLIAKVVQYVAHLDGDVFWGDANVGLLRLADWVAQQLTRCGRECIGFFVVEERLAVVRFEGHQDFERSDSTNFSTLAEGTCRVGTTRCSNRAEALVERATA